MLPRLGPSEVMAMFPPALRLPFRLMLSAAVMVRLRPACRLAVVMEPWFEAPISIRSPFTLMLSLGLLKVM